MKRVFNSLVKFVVLVGLIILVGLSTPIRTQAACNPNVDGYGTCGGTCAGGHCGYIYYVSPCGCIPDPAPTDPPLVTQAAPTLTPRPTQIPITPGAPTPTGIWFNCGTGTYCTTGYYCCSLGQCCAVGDPIPTHDPSSPTNTPVPTTPPVATPTPGGAPIVMYNCRTDVDPNPNNSYTCLSTSPSSPYDNNAAGIALCQTNLATYAVYPYPVGAAISTGICYNTQSACISNCCRKIYWCQNDGTCAQTANNYYSNDGPGNPGYLDCNNNLNSTCTQNLQTLVAGGYIAPLNNYACYSTQASCQASCFPPTIPPTIPPTLVPTSTPIPGAWTKLKDTSFVSTKNLVNNIPAVPALYSPTDPDDTTQAYFIINNGGITNSGGVVVAPNVGISGMTL